MKKFEFEATIEEGHRGGAWIKIPFSVPEEFEARGRVKVKATFDGHPYRGSIAPMGGAHILGIQKTIRKSIGKSISDSVHVYVEEDIEPRVVEVPEELKSALEQNTQAKTFFEKLAYSRQKEYAEWVRSAKKPETRQRRTGKAIDALSKGEKR